MASAKKTVVTAFAHICVTASLLLPLASLAATPVAVWDGNFNAVQPGYTLNLNGNQLSADNSVITITDDYAGIDINFDSDHKDSGVTLIVRYEGLVKGTKAKAIATQCNSSGYTTDRTGVDLQADNTLWGMWYNNGWADSGSKSAAGVFPSSGCFAFTYKPDSGTYLYVGSDTSTIASTSAYGSSSLKASNDGLWGVTVGGMRSGTVNSNWRAAQGARITAIAVFDSVLSTAEMNEYKFPMDGADPVTSDTTVSALNAQFGSATDLKLKFSPGVKLTMDTTFTATSVKIVSGGSVELVAAAQPDAAELAKLDLSGVQVAVKRSWLEPDVISFNFTSKWGSNTSAAFATGTWLSTYDDTTGSTNVCADGLSTFAWSATGVYAYSPFTSFIDGYLDDNATTGNGPEITVSAIPYETYDLIIYCGTSGGTAFHSKVVNGTSYSWDSESQKVVKGSGSWGICGQADPEYGVNTLRINGLTGPLSIQGGLKTGTIRGGISAIQIIPADVVIDATSGFTPDATRLANIRKDYRGVTLVGDGANGATIDFGSTTATISSHIVFDGGTHTVTYNNSGTANIAFADNTSKPVFETMNGATVNLYSIDLSGWQGSAAAKVPRSNILVRDGTVFNFLPNAARTFYYQGRFTVEPGAVLATYYTHQNNVFRMNGGAVEGSEQIYVPASDAQSPGTATIDGCEGNTGLNLPSDSTPGLGVYVGENSTLDMNIDVSGVAGAPLGKWGDGTLNLNGDLSGYAGTFTVHAGRVNVTTATTLASVVNDEGATLAYSVAAKPIIGSYSGQGSIVVDVSSLVQGGTIASGTYQIAPSGAPSALVTVTGLPEGSGFKVVATEDNGIVLTDEVVFSPEWTGASSTWTSEVYDGRTGYEDGKHLVFSQGVAPEESVTVTVAGAKAPASMSFIAGATAYTLTGDRITTTEDVTANGTASVVVSNELSIGGSLVLNAGSEFTLASETLPIQSGALSGAGTLVLDPGAGRSYTMPAANTDFTGEAVIKSGTVKMGDATSFGPTGRSSAIRVKDGATLDTNGATNSEYGKEKNKVILENGATFTSTVANSIDFRDVPCTVITLEGNATVDASIVSVGLAQGFDYNSARLEIGPYTLQKTGSFDFRLSAINDIPGTGVIDIMNGSISICNSIYGNHSASMSNGTIKVASGAYFKMVQVNGKSPTFTVRNLELDGTITREGTESTLTVTGYVSGSGTTPMLTLAEGAKFKPNGTGYLVITESLVLPNDTLTIDISDLDFTGDGPIPLFCVGDASMLPESSAITFAGGTLPDGWTLEKARGGRGYKLSKGASALLIKFH